MANTMSIDQINVLLRSILSQATGRTDLAALDTTQLLTIGQAAVAAAPDPVLESISQVLSKTIFSSRPYKAKFAKLRKDPVVWGNVVRKLAILDKETDVDKTGSYELVDGKAVDQYQVDNTEVLELQFVGQQTYTITKTIYKDQFRVCFNNAEEFGRFISAIMTYVYNKVEKLHEECCRSTITGAAASLLADKAQNPGRIIHLLTEYNTLTGKTLDATTVYANENFSDFVTWLYSRINNIADLMGEYSTLYQTKLTKGFINRATPLNKMEAFFYAPFFRQAQNRVLAATYHDNLLQLIPGSEMVNYWQSIETPGKINVTNPKYLDADCVIQTAAGPVEQDYIFGIMADEEAMGMCPILNDVSQTPYNARGHYWNYYWQYNERYYMDPTEKIVLLVLD